MKKNIALWLLLLSFIFLTIALISRFIFLYKYGPNWVTGQPLNWPNEVLVVIGICSIPGILLKVAKELVLRVQGRNNELLNDWRIHMIVVFLILSFYFYHIQPHVIKLRGTPGEWLYDSYVKILVANKFRGPILSDEPYHLVINLENKASVPVYIPKIVVVYSNAKVAKLFRMKSDVTFTHENHVPHHLQPNEKKEISLDCNEILPQIAQVEIYHNFSAGPSTFYIDLESKSQDPPCPPRFPETVVNQGLSSLNAIRRAQLKAETWHKKANLFACFPADSKTFFDSTTRLKYVEATSWIVNFCSPTGKTFTVIAKEDDDVGMEVNAKCIWTPNPLPEIGYQEALSLANRNHLLCADWKSIRLTVGKVANEYINVWFLPYRGRDSLPLIIDAQSGYTLNLAGVDGEIPIFEKMNKLR